MADNLTKQLIETVKNKVPLTGGLSIKGYPVMGTLSDMKNFKIEEGVLKLRYGTKTVASFDNKRFYFLKNFEFCSAEVLIGLDYQLCLHAFFENYEGYDFIVRDASQWHKNEMQLPQNQLVIGKDENDRDIISDPWTLGKLFDNGTQFWAYENQKYIMFFNDCGEIRVIVKDGGFKIHKNEQYIEVDIKDATNRVFNVPPALKEDKRGKTPAITGEYRFARVNELGVISELTEPQYLQTWKRVIACCGDEVSLPQELVKTENYEEISNAQKDYGLMICGKNLKKYTIGATATDDEGGSGLSYNPASVIQYARISNQMHEFDESGCWLFSRINPAELDGKMFWLDVKHGDIHDIYDTVITTSREVFQKKEDGRSRNFQFYVYSNPAKKYSQVIFGEEQGNFPCQWFKDGAEYQFENAFNLKFGDAATYTIHAHDLDLDDYSATPYTPGNDTDVYEDFYLTELAADERLIKKSLGNMFVITWWIGKTQHILMGEGTVYVIDEIPYKESDGIKTIQEYTISISNPNNPFPGKKLYKFGAMDTIQRVISNTIPFKTSLNKVTRDTAGYFYSRPSDKGRFAIWNDNKILGISQRFFVGKDSSDIPIYRDNNADPENLLVRYSPVLGLEFANQRSFRFELPLIRKAIRKPQFLCVSNNYVYEFENNRLWYGSAYDFMLTGYTYLDGSLLKLIAYNEGVLACTTSGLYYVNREVVQPVVNGRAIRADFAGETQVGGVVIAENKVYIVRTEITDSGARIETANLISEPINELVFNGEIKLACNKRQLYLADDFNVYGFDTKTGIWNLRYNYNNKHIASIFMLDNRLGVLFDNEVDAAKANKEYEEPISPR